MKKLMLKFSLALLVILLFLAVFMQFRARLKGKEFFDDFNNADIDNQIEFLRVAYKGTQVRLIDGREFVFYPITDDKLNDSKIFIYNAQRGDKVIKKAFSDTLYLQTKEGVYLYTFKKFD